MGKSLVCLNSSSAVFIIDCQISRLNYYFHYHRDSLFFEKFNLLSMEIINYPIGEQRTD